MTGFARNIMRLTFAILVLATVPVSAVKAQSQDTAEVSRTYLTPFPENDIYNVYVFGDTLGEGLANGLGKLLAEDTRFSVFRKIHYGHSLAKARGKNWNTRLGPILENETVHIAVIFTGISERINIWTGGKKYKVGTEKWREIVGQSADKLIKQLQSNRVAVYWLGIPVMAKKNVNNDMQILNDIFRERAFINGAKYIDTWNAFADQFGRFTAFGPDISGAAKRLRANDGIHFTGAGNRKLAHYVQKEIVKDLALAREERNIPLAGNQQEQRKIHEKAKSPLKRAAEIAKKMRGKTDKPGKKVTKGWFSLLSATTSEVAKSEDAKTTSDGEIRILRPRLSEATLASLANRSNKTPSSSFTGEPIAKPFGEDLTALGSISPANVVSLRNIKDTVPLTQTPYYKVLIKGEPQSPKPGRADDFTWPKPEPKTGELSDGIQNLINKSG